MFALLGNILTAECGSAYSRNIYIYIEKLKMIYAAWSIMSEGESSAYQSNLNPEGLMRTDF